MASNRARNHKNGTITHKKNGETDETYRTRKGLKLALPIYYRNKIYAEEEKEKLWIEKLDKKERWIDGEKESTTMNVEEVNKQESSRTELIERNEVKSTPFTIISTDENNKIHNKNIWSTIKNRNIYRL